MTPTFLAALLPGTILILAAVGLWMLVHRAVRAIVRWPVLRLLRGAWRTLDKRNAELSESRITITNLLEDTGNYARENHRCRREIDWHVGVKREFRDAIETRIQRIRGDLALRNEHPSWSQTLDAIKSKRVTTELRTKPTCDEMQALFATEVAGYLGDHDDEDIAGLACDLVHAMVTKGLIDYTGEWGNSKRTTDHEQAAEALFQTGDCAVGKQEQSSEEWNHLQRVIRGLRGALKRKRGGK